MQDFASNSVETLTGYDMLDVQLKTEYSQLGLPHGKID